MNKIIITLFLTSLIVLSSKAQDLKTDTVTIKVSSVCEMCKETIEKALAYTKGVKKSEVDYENKMVFVIYKPNKTNPDLIRAAIAEVGYNADNVLGDHEAYEKLPKCCKYKDATNKCDDASKH
jgi:copper chaperone CopZ